MSEVINIENQFADALADAGFPATEIVADGAIHRFAGPEDKRGKKNAWYVLHIGHLGAGAYGDWKTGVKSTWCSKSESTFTSEDREHWKRQQQEIRAAVEKETKARNAEAAVKAKRIWDNARDATDDNPYCVAKGVKPYGLKEFKDVRTLIVPVSNSKGDLVSLQFISSDGTKKFLSGGQKASCYYIIGPTPKDRIIVAEGFATAATLYAATGLPVAVAFDCGNLRSVAAAVKANLPANCKITIAADDDAATAGNPGISAATDAARAVNGLLAVPDFGDDRPADASDFNDLARHAGLEAVKFCLAAASRPGGVAPLARADKRTTPKVLLTCAADVIQEEINWLWQDWLPAGMFSLLAGAPGTGKTTLAIALGASVTTGGAWPDGTSCPEAGNVLMWSGEDDIATVLAPRLSAAGANLRKVHFVSNRIDENGELQPFDPSSDVSLLGEKLSEMGGAKLLIIDPIVSAVSGDTHRGNDVRRDLQPLVDLAMSYGCAVLGISHFSKGSKGSSPSERVLGSVAFVGQARMVLVAGKDETSERRILARSKSNIAPDDGGISYTLEMVETDRIKKVSRVIWGEAISGTAREILADVEESSEERGPREEARDFLLAILADGPVNAKEIRKDAEGAGFSQPTVHRAASDLGVEKRKLGMKEGWVWALPKISGGEDFTKNSTLYTVNSSASPEIFRTYEGLRSVPFPTSAEEFKPESVESSLISSETGGQCAAPSDGQEGDL